MHEDGAPETARLVRTIKHSAHDSVCHHPEGLDRDPSAHAGNGLAPTPSFSRVVCEYVDDEQEPGPQGPRGGACWSSYQKLDKWTRSPAVDLPAVDARAVRTHAELEAQLVALAHDDLSDTLLSIETHGTEHVPGAPWEFALDDIDFHGPRDWPLLSGGATPRLRPALALIGGCFAGTPEGRACVEACLADGVAYVASTRVTRAGQLSGRVLPAVLRASSTNLPLGGVDSDDEGTLNGMLALPYGATNTRPAWTAWRAYVAGAGR